MRQANELEFFIAIESCSVCRELQITAILGDKYGVVVVWQGKQVGMWGWIEGALKFRSLANWEPYLIASDALAARAATIKMAEAGSWVR